MVKILSNIALINIINIRLIQSSAPMIQVSLILIN